VSAAQVQQHAVTAGNRNHAHAGYTRTGIPMAWHHRSIADLSSASPGRMRSGGKVL
jgi:hypothetical protein